MKSKPLQITADMFNSKALTGLMDFLAFVSPAKTKDEEAIRARDRQKIADGELGSPVERKPANINGKLDRDRILCGASIFGGTPEVTENDIRLIADAGFDFIINGNAGDYGRKINDWCLKYGVATIDYENREFFGKPLESLDFDDPALFSGFAPHAASVGDCGIDEPHTSAFSFVAALHRASMKALPGRFIFSNLLPAGALKAALGAKSYKEYVERYSDEVPGDYLSVDIYPFHPCRILNKAEMAICLHTYHTVGNTCRRDGKDFWLYIQSQMRWFSHLYTMTTSEMIRWQVYASLCYGCRSIIHASYNPVWGDDAIGIIDYDGNLTEQYLYVKKVNSEIQKLSPVIKNYRSLGVMFTKAKKLNHHFVFAVPSQKKDNRIQGFGGIGEVAEITGEATALAGFFENPDGRKALMLVNCGCIYDPYIEQNITVKLTAEHSVAVYEHGEKTREEKTRVITVCPGSCDGIFITLD